MLLTSDPMFSRPQLDRPYNSWREAGGKLPDGRHYKNFYLLDTVVSGAFCRVLGCLLQVLISGGIESMAANKAPAWRLPDCLWSV
eukprot:1136394-Pelagomonas_calceolata.AAC.6